MCLTRKIMPRMAGCPHERRLADLSEANAGGGVCFFKQAMVVRLGDFQLAASSSLAQQLFHSLAASFATSSGAQFAQTMMVARTVDGVVGADGLGANIMIPAASSPHGPAGDNASSFGSRHQDTWPFRKCQSSHGDGGILGGNRDEVLLRVLDALANGLGDLAALPIRNRRGRRRRPRPSVR